jgi:hypothetical protein
MKKLAAGHCHFLAEARRAADRVTENLEKLSRDRSQKASLQIEEGLFLFPGFAFD